MQRGSWQYKAFLDNYVAVFCHLSATHNPDRISIIYTPCLKKDKQYFVINFDKFKGTGATSGRQYLENNAKLIK